MTDLHKMSNFFGLCAYTVQSALQVISKCIKDGLDKSTVGSKDEEIIFWHIFILEVGDG